MNCVERERKLIRENRGKPYKMVKSHKKQYYYYRKKYPNWAKFLDDLVIVIESGFHYRHITEANITEEIMNVGYLPLHDMWHFSFEWPMGDKDLEDIIYDNTVDWWKRSSSQSNGYWGSPYITSKISDGINGVHKEDLYKAEKAFELFTNYYECFR